jgi:hypothetical protein
VPDLIAGVPRAAGRDDLAKPAATISQSQQPGPITCAPAERTSPTEPTANATTHATRINRINRISLRPPLREREVLDIFRFQLVRAFSRKRTRRRLPRERSRTNGSDEPLAQRAPSPVGPPAEGRPYQRRRTSPSRYGRVDAGGVAGAVVPEDRRRCPAVRCRPRQVRQGPHSPCRCSLPNGHEAESHSVPTTLYVLMSNAVRYPVKWFVFRTERTDPRMLIATSRRVWSAPAGPRPTPMG